MKGPKSGCRMQSESSIIGQSSRAIMRVCNGLIILKVNAKRGINIELILQSKDNAGWNWYKACCYLKDTT